MAASSTDKTLPDNCISTDLPSLDGQRWTKAVALYGANASGKSTLIKAMAALSQIVQMSAKVTDPKEPIAPIEPFGLGTDEPAKPTAFAISFVAEKSRYEYRVAATRERVWHESLRAFPEKKAQTWFNREWNPNTASYEWSPERPTGFQRDPQLEGYTLPNMLFLSKAVASNRPELEPVFRWFKERLQFLNLGAHFILPEGFSLAQIEQKTSLSARIVALLKHADLGVTGAHVVEQAPPPGLVEHLKAMPAEQQELFRRQRFIKPELRHRAKAGDGIPLPWETESAGTQRFFSLAGPWLHYLATGCVVCVDELESSMHPLMVRELLRLVFSAKEGDKGAQIIFTTHNPLLLDTTLLRRDQVWFTDKDETGEAHLYPLTDYSPRKGESLIRGYLSGRYGAVPFVPTGLTGEFPAHEVLRENHE